MIMTAADDKFLDEAESLIRSCARYSPDQGFYLFLVNSTEERVAPLREVHPKLIVEHVEWTYEPDRWRGLMISARTGPIVHLLETYKEPVVCLDSDTILLGPLDELFKALDTYDVMIRHNPNFEMLGPAGTMDAAKFNAGVTAYGASEAGMKFAREYHRRTREWIDARKPLIIWQEAQKGNAYIDQELLYLVYKDLKDELRFKDLPGKFNDSKFRPGSIVWHGKGTARKHPRYVSAKLSYGKRLRYYSYFLFSLPLRFAYYIVWKMKSKR